jgi:hypothetical protein
MGGAKQQTASSKFKVGIPQLTVLVYTSIVVIFEKN